MSEYVPEGQAEVTPEPVEEPWYSQVSQEDFEAMRETHQQIQEAIRQAEAQPQPQEQDGYDPDDYVTAAQAREMNERMIEQRIQPLIQTYEQQQWEKGQADAKDVIADYATEKGYELSTTDEHGKTINLADHIIPLAAKYVPETQQKFGVGTQRAAEAALARATDELMNAIGAFANTREQQRINQLQGLRNAPRELPATGPQAGQQLHDRGGSEVDLVSQFFNGR